MKDFRPTLERLADVFLPRGERRGADESSIRRAEDRLGVRLPGPLRDFYAVAGGSPSLMGAIHQFRPLDRLELLDGRVVFCDENQGAYYWGVPVASPGDGGGPDPPADVRHGRESEWHLDSSSLSELLTHFACWQLVNIMPASGRFTYGRKLKHVLPPTFVDICPLCIAYQMRSYGCFDRRMLVSAFVMEKEAYVAAGSDEELQAFESQTGVDLDWL